ncbi:MAG: hypothetical protein GWO41_13600 [candidate division Zixibacteria bacterium]|nr:hypothetical protein [candidate division Zixibacteria bacterium]NIW45659.1 hypothetical protein [Gammaproteobacteria bacterium]NIX56876.1 hypothetical protein [candidate division Zixibacteria bacterium]
MAIADVTISGVTFKAPSEWQFVPTEDFILARRDSRIGIFRISVMDSSTLINQTADELLKTAEKFFVNSKNPEPFDIKRPIPDASVFGAATYKVKESKRDFLTRIWYHSKSENLIFAAYGCPWHQRNEEVTQTELQECERMILTVQFGKEKKARQEKEG